MIPGMPKISFLHDRRHCGRGWPVVPKPKPAEESSRNRSGRRQRQLGRPAGKLLKLDEMSLEVGYALVPLVDAQTGRAIAATRAQLRSHLAVQLGFIIPSVHITDNLKLKPREYTVSLRGVEVSRWELHEDRLLAISSEVNPPRIAGIETREPAFGVNALWILRSAARPGARCRICGGRADLDDGHPPGRSD